VLSKQVAGEKPTLGETDSFSYSIGKKLAVEVSGAVITTEKDGDRYGFKLPDAKVLFGDNFPKEEISFLVRIFYTCDDI
jgi:hypothetical protein